MEQGACNTLTKLQAGRNTAFHFSRDFDERIRYEENIVGGGAAAVLKTMRVSAEKTYALTAVAFTAEPA